MDGVSIDSFYAAINKVEASLIRVDADEVTYNLHVMIRFELEQQLVEDELAVADLPDAWNQKYRDYLGITPPDDRDGVLQDVHWSAGLFGYFPTYALGNLCAAQFMDRAEADIGPLADLFARGQFEPLRGWLDEKIYATGQCDTAAELVERVTGKPLGHESLMAHLHGRFGPLYGVDGC